MAAQINREPVHALRHANSCYDRRRRLELRGWKGALRDIWKSRLDQHCNVAHWQKSGDGLAVTEIEVCFQSHLKEHEFRGDTIKVPRANQRLKVSRFPEWTTPWSNNNFFFFNRNIFTSSFVLITFKDTISEMKNRKIRQYNQSLYGVINLYISKGSQNIKQNMRIGLFQL